MGLSDDSLPGKTPGPDRLDPRILRSRQLLWDALVDLIGETGYAAVNVQDISRRAGVNRATFYRHFEDKDDLFRQGCTAFIHRFIDTMPRRGSGNPGQTPGELIADLQVLLGKIEGQRATFRILAGTRSNPDVQGIAADVLSDYVLHERLTCFFPGVPVGNSMLQLMARTTTTMFLGIFFWWALSDDPVTIEKLGQIFASIMQNGVMSLRLQ